MIDPLFLRNLFVVFSGFSPLVALWVSSVKQLNSRRVAFFVESALFGLFLYVLFFLPYVYSKTFPAVLSLYPLFLFLFNLILLLKFKPKVFSKIFSVSLMLSFVLTELHELPAFAFSYWNLEFLQPERLIFFVSPFYALAVFVLAAKTFNLSLSFRSKVLLIFSLMGIFVFYWINPLIDINGIPSVWVYLKRAYCFIVLAITFFIGGNPQNE